MATAESYLFLIRETSPETYAAMSAEERRHCLDRWNEWVDGLVARGEVQHGQPLEDGVRLVGRGGRALDGPFAEAKELVGGYFLVSAANLEEATAIAQTCPSLEYGMTIEIRPIAEACHLARSLGWETMREPASA